ncbi:MULTISPECIES: M28 family metallopeptidase [unclassified Roseateles]|uniref:M28 family metallopeptidase n=1 Tax=unclassified Roseateles TaxID=2626991 RepID=UPI0006F2CF7E|nr:MULTISPECIES: M28 family metallopeptidase [unclassified Roseateles]KQW51366.1 aminopeptidase [Pelomonas sp. Root405]KRA77598.1 aminopeptidase [Pelomonas sp. Root662]
MRFQPAALVLTLLAATAQAQSPADDLKAMLAEVSPARIEARIRKLAAFGTRHTLSDIASETRGIGAARRWITAELSACAKAAGGRLQVEEQSFIEPAGTRMPQPTELVNIVATLPGRGASKARVLVVSGHYDSRNSDVMDSLGEAPGANDDASGTAAVMELACVMAKRQFDATLVFMAVPGEEQGLLGAAQWAREARASGVNVEAMITNDIIGSATGDAGQRDPKRMRLFADGLDPLVRLLTAASANRPPSEADARSAAAMQAELLPLLQAGGSEDLPTHQLGRHLKAAAEGAMPGFTVQLIQRRDRYLRGGDHLPFLERGYAAVRFSEPFENFAHQHQNPRTENGVVYGDLPEFVDFAYVADVTRANLAGLATLAWAPAPLRGVRLDARELTNDSTLEWQASDDPEVAGYRVVWRDTDAATWQQFKDVGRTTRVTLPVSKDNVVFGVQAVSKKGFAGLASYTLPRR